MELSLNLIHFIKYYAHFKKNESKCCWGGCLRKWFFDRFSPVTNIKAVGNADVTYGLAIDGEKVTRKELTIEATVTTLCPCSKEISEYSAHNQRGIVTVKTYLDKDAEVVDDYKDKILDAMEANASSILYPILKRPDENVSQNVLMKTHVS